MRENKAEFAKRREQLMAEIGQGNAGLVLAATEVFRNNDTHYPFRQNSDFYYLTGLCEPEALALFLPGRKEGEFILFVRERDPAQEIWTGRRVGNEGAKAIYGADEAFSIAQMDEMLLKLLLGCSRIYYPMKAHPGFDQRLLGWVQTLQARSRAGVTAPSELVNIGSLIHEQRLIKTAVEIASMREAAEITVAAHQRAMQACRPGLYEYELEATLQYEFIRRGCRFSAYESIVASGANSCTLHYVDNTAQMQEGDLVLVDAGAECNYYASDVTRSFPVNGCFSPDQKAIYELVLQTQLAVIAEIAPGVRWNHLEEVAARTLTNGLLHLGILKGRLEQLVKDKAYRHVYMHRIGHWLGLDVHDVGSYHIEGDWRPLKPGMVLTVEPGIYIPEGAEGINKRWWGIGVRIEDDVLVTDSGSEVLTRGLAKTVEEVEALCKITTSALLEQG